MIAEAPARRVRTASERFNRFMRFLFTRDGKNLLRADDGAEVVEFAVASGVFFLFLFGLMEMCLVFFMYQTAAEAARETSRWASVRGVASSVTVNGVTTCSNPNITGCPAALAQVESYGKTLVGASSMNVQAWWCNSDGQTSCVQDPSKALKGNIVKVKVSYTLASMPFVPTAATTVSSTSEMVIWQ